MNAVQTRDESACRSDAANDDALVPRAWEDRLTGLKKRVMARIAHGIAQAAGQPPVSANRRSEPGADDAPERGRGIRHIAFGPPHGRARGRETREASAATEIDRSRGWRREATTRAMDEVLIVTSHHRIRVFDRLQPEDHDENLSFGPAQIDRAGAGRSERSDGVGIDEPAGSLLGSSDAASAVPSPSLAVLSAIPSLAKRVGDDMTACTVEIILAYLATNTISPTDLPKLISDLNKVLREVSEKDLRSENGLRPAVPISKSVTPDYIICLEDGRRFKSMKRHLRATYNLSPDEYRDKWGLPETYPMIAPNYAKLCSDRAKEQGLGRHISGN